MSVLLAAGRLLARSRRARAWAGPDAVAVLGRCAAASLAGAALLGTSGTGVRAATGATAGAIAGWHAGPALHRRSLRAHHARIRAALPDALDRLTICVAAGMSVERALRTVAPRTPGALGEAFDDGLRALDLGLPRTRAYERIAAHADEEGVAAMMGALIRAERYGTSVASALRAHADEMRSRARRRRGGSADRPREAGLPDRAVLPARVRGADGRTDRARGDGNAGRHLRASGERDGAIPGKEVIRMLRSLRAIREGAQRWVLGIMMRVRTRSEAGQATTEYTLVILVAATVALLLLNWAKGGAIVAFFDTIFDKVVAMFSDA